MRRRPGMREVAERAGVAMSSVSRVLSGHPDVSNEMRQRVLAAVEELGYEPDMLAQSLRRRATLSVGFVLSDISNPLFAEMIMGVESTLNANGYSMLLTSSLGDADLEASHIRLLAQRRVDAIILSVVDERHALTIQRLRELDIPITVLDRDLPSDIGVSAVLVDHRQGMTAAVEHLFSLGHHRLALIVGQPVRPARERRQAFVDAFEARGLPPTYTILDGTFSEQHGRSAMRSLLDLPDPPTAVIAGGNQLMLGALRVVAQRGIELGRDMSFVGCDDVAIADLHRPPISVVRRDNVEMGRRAASLVLGQLRDSLGPTALTLPTEFVARASCGPVPR